MHNDQSPDLEKGEVKGEKSNSQRNWKSSVLWIANIVPNKDSTARDHLANERTFLAWLRTSLALIGFGIIIMKFSSDIKAIIAGLIFVILGILLFFYSSVRYYFIYHLLKNDYFAPTSWGLASVIALCLVSLVVAGILILLSSL